MHHRIPLTSSFAPPRDHADDECDGNDQIRSLHDEYRIIQNNSNSEVEVCNLLNGGPIDRPTVLSLFRFSDDTFVFSRINYCAPLLLRSSLAAVCCLILRPERAPFLADILSGVNFWGRKCENPAENVATAGSSRQTELGGHNVFHSLPASEIYTTYYERTVLS